MQDIAPIRSKVRLQVLDSQQLGEIRSATLHVLEQVGVRFPSEKALKVFAEHGAQVDVENQLVRIPSSLVLGAMKTAPRAYLLAGRAQGTDLLLDGTSSYFGTDGCGTMTVDFETREERPSTKEDVAKMARVVDYLPSVSFYWPMVSAQDYGRLAPLHELEASFNNTVKHIQMETVMGAVPATYAVRMAEAIAGSVEEMRQRPPFSNLICTVAPLGQDKDGIEAAMVFAEAGIPVGFMGMPTMGSTAPATPGGALVVGNAEVVSAMVLMQLVAPGAPVFHSLLASVMDPRTADYIVSIPEKYLCNVAAVEMAHDWGVPSLAGAFGLDHTEPGTWKLGRDSVYTSLMVSLVGADTVVASGLLKASTLLLPEQIIYDDEVYHVNRVVAEGVDTSSTALGVDVIADVGPGGHFLSQKHTRKHMRDIWIPELSHPRKPLDGSPPPNLPQLAKTKVDEILAQHQPLPLDEALQAELKHILKAAEREIMN